jgi:hypothetical protein
MTPRASKATKGAAKTAKPGGYRQLLRWAALPVTNRRWAAPLWALALGFGLFVGVAIGPGASGTFATGAAQILEVPGFTGGTGAGDGEDEDEGGSPSPTVAAAAAGGGGGGIPPSESSLPSFAPVESSQSEEAEATEPSEPPPPKEAQPPAAEQPEEEEETLTGIVLHVNPAAGSYTIADSAGTLSAIHAVKTPKPGMKVSISTRLLANGTLAESGPREKLATRVKAAFNGVVTYVDPTPSAPAYTVSKRGASVLVRVQPDPTGAVPPLPLLGAFANVEVDIEKPPPPPASPAASGEQVALGGQVTSGGQVADVSVPTSAGEAPPPAAPATEPAPAAPAACAPDPSQPPLPVFNSDAVLWQRQLSAGGAPFTFGDFAGIVEAVCADSGELLISADDTRQGLHDLLFKVPSGIETKKLKAGESVLATANIGTDGSLSLTGLASDERTKGAENLKAAQGDLAPTKRK